MIFKITEVPNVKLREISRVVDKIDDDVRTIVNDMFDTLYSTNNGVGLSAIQIGIPRRIVVIDAQRDKESQERHGIVFINPVLTWKSEQKALMPEGCLSVPGCQEQIMRHLEVEVTYTDMDEKQQSLRVDGLLSHCLQHELEHLDGILFIDHLSKLKRDMVLEKLKKYKK